MRIAVIAHDNKKADMVAFVMKRLDFFKKVDVMATGTTGKHIEHAGLDVNCLKSGPLGGDAQIASLISDGEIDELFDSVDNLSQEDIESIKNQENIKNNEDENQTPKNQKNKNISIEKLYNDFKRFSKFLIIILFNSLSYLTKSNI